MSLISSPAIVTESTAMMATAATTRIRAVPMIPRILPALAVLRFAGHDGLAVRR